MDNCERILALLQQNRMPIQISKIAEKLGIDQGTVYRHLRSLDLQGKAHYERGIAYLEREAAAPGSAEAYFGWRASPEGGNNRFFRGMGFRETIKKVG